MSTLEEVKRAISFFKKKNITLLHCMSCYPTKNTDANLINIQKLKERFNLDVGYSDHTEGIEAAANSVFFGAMVIEKHFMPKTTHLAGDYKLSIDQKKLKKLVLNIKKLSINRKRKNRTI